jgi:ribose transport system ATP-binding protein
MSEVYRICDRITLLRDGKLIFTDDIQYVDTHRLLEGIIGSKNTNQFPEKYRETGDVIFEAKNISSAGKYEDVSFELREGEILGFAGLAGAGRTEIAKTIFGVYHLDAGEFIYKGEKLNIKSPEDAVKKGIGYVSEDRKEECIMAVRSILENMSISNLNRLGKNFHIDKREETKEVEEQIESLKVKTTGKEQAIENLSGGNQQKVCLGKWLMARPNLLLLDEPTRGVDVGARAEIYALIRALASAGTAVVVISSEIEEVLGLSDRVLVVADGRVIHTTNAQDIDEHGVLDLVMKGSAA